MGYSGYGFLCHNYENESIRILRADLAYVHVCIYVMFFICWLSFIELLLFYDTLSEMTK